MSLSCSATSLGNRSNSARSAAPGSGCSPCTAAASMRQCSSATQRFQQALGHAEPSRDLGDRATEIDHPMSISTLYSVDASEIQQTPFRRTNDPAHSVSTTRRAPQTSTPRTNLRPQDSRGVADSPTILVAQPIWEERIAHRGSTTAKTTPGCRQRPVTPGARASAREHSATTSRMVGLDGARFAGDSDRGTRRPVVHEPINSYRKPAALTGAASGCYRPLPEGRRAAHL